jgi:hypothetical protein
MIGVIINFLGPHKEKILKKKIKKNKKQLQWRIRKYEGLHFLNNK